MPVTSSQTLNLLVISFDGPASESGRVESLLSAGVRAHYLIDHADSPAAALETFRRSEHDVVLLLESPRDETARDVLREAVAEASGIPIIFLAAATDSSLGEAALQNGAADHLDLATLGVAELECAIHAALRVAAVQSELRESRRELDLATRSAAVAGERNRSAQLLHSILRNLPVIAGQLDGEARVVDAQGAGLLPQGIRPERLIGRVFTELFPQSRNPIADALAGGATSFILTGRTRGQEWHAEFFVTFDPGERGGATFLGRDITDRRWLEVNLLNVSDAEQQRLGTDLHDGLGQQLTGLAFMAAALRDRLKASLPEEVPQADALAKLAREATVQSRALARGLHPVQLERHGLVAALEELATQSQVLHGITCRFQHKGPIPVCEHPSELHIYRIVQEAIRNAVRHGAAQHITITLASRGRAHRIAINDNGHGFDPAQVRDTKGRGLRLMGYRATMIGGTFTVASRPHHGARIACTFADSAPLA